MTERDFETLDKLIADRAERISGPRRWLRAYLAGLVLLTLGAIGTLGYVTFKHPPPPGTSLGSHLQFTLALVVQQLGYETQALKMFQVIHTPGHSPGEIMLWEAESGILFSGDTVYDGPLIDDAYHSDVPAYIASMKQVVDLPVRVVHGGHFPSFDGSRYRELIRGYLEEKGA